MVEDYQENYGSGWISVYRSIKGHWIWSDPVKLKWWLTILFEVNHSDNKVSIGYELHQIKSGQSAKSLRTWAKEFDTGTKSVVKFFDMLEKDGMIKRETIGKGKQSTTMLTVCNYGTYQKQKPKTETQRGTQRGTQGGTLGEHNGVREGGTNNNANNYNNENNEEQKGARVYFSDPKLNDAFTRWLKMCGEKGKPYPPTSIEAIQMKLNRDNNALEKVNQSLEKGWITLHSIDAKAGEKPTHSPTGEKLIAGMTEAERKKFLKVTL